MPASPLFDVRDCVTLITGAAGGLGLAMAEAFAAGDARVVLADNDGERLERATARLREDGGTVEGVTLDVSNAAAVQAAVDGVCQAHGRLDVAILNAGISVGPGFDAPAGEIENVALDTWTKVLAVNLTGTFLTLQSVCAAMKQQHRGRIVVVSSMAGLRSQPSIGYAYIASKAGVAALTRQAALEMAPFRVHVNGVAPGPFATGIGGGRLHQPEVAAHFAAMSPLNRVAKADEIVGAALFLASAAASFVTGAIVPVDGGMSAL